MKPLKQKRFSPTKRVEPTDGPTREYYKNNRLLKETP